MAVYHLLLPVILMTSTRIVFSTVPESIGSAKLIDLCDSSLGGNKIQCYCRSVIVANKSFVFKAECTVNEENIPVNDEIWRAFSLINTIEILALSSQNGALTYIPTPAIKTLRGLLKLTIQHGKIDHLHSYAFANLSNIEEVKLSGNNIKELHVNTFAHLPNITSITLENNNIEEIKRNVFRRMPLLRSLSLASNNISMVHDRAFSHISNLRILELDKNNIFVLTNETFLGLENLTRLELSYNNLEVVGENTFEVLTNLRSLNLANNKIRLLDDRAFNGLLKLESISLAHNNIKELSNPKLFLGLPMLYFLNVKSNGMKSFKNETITPILQNFYTIGSSLGFEENSFTCDCNLNWFLTLKNRTQNKHLQDTIQNLMCIPSPKLAEDFKKFEESDSINTARVNDKSNTANEYDYYDDTSMDGKLFFIDIPYNILPCDNISPHTTSLSSNNQYTTVHHTTDMPKTTVSIKTTQLTLPTTYLPSSTVTTSIVSEEREHVTPPTHSTSSVFSTNPSTLKTSQIFTSATHTTSSLHVVKHKENEANTQIENKPLSLTTKIFTSVRNLSPTEEMVSDGENPLTTTNSITSTTYGLESPKTEEIVSTLLPIINKEYSGNRNQHKLIVSTSNQHIAPESMSRVHNTNATSAASKIVVCLFPGILLLMIGF